MEEQQIRDSQDRQREASRNKKWLFPTLLFLFAVSVAAWSISRIALGPQQSERNVSLPPMLMPQYAGPLAFSSQGGLLACGDGNSPAEVRLLNLATRQFRLQIKTEHIGGVGLVAWSPDNHQLITSGAHDDERTFMWDAHTGDKIGQVSGILSVANSFVFSHDGKVLVKGSAGGTEVYDLISQRLLFTLPEPTGTVFAFPLSDRSTFLSVSNQVAKVYQLRSGKLLRTVKLVDQKRRLILAALSPDGRTLAIATRPLDPERTYSTPPAPEQIELWDWPGGRLLHTLPDNAGASGKPALQALTFSPDGRRLVSSTQTGFHGGAYTGTIRLREVSTGRVLRVLDIPARSLAFSPGGKTLAAGVGREIRLWNVAALKAGE